MAPKRSGNKKKKKVIGTVLKSTRKIIEESVKVSVIEGNSTQEQETQEEDENQETQEPLIRTIPIQESTQEEESIEISVQGPKENEAKDQDSLRNQEQKTDQETVQEKEHRKKEKGQSERNRKKRKGRGIERASEGYRRYVFKVLKQVHPELRISSMAMSVINSLMKDMFERIADEAAKLNSYAHKTTLSSREIQDAVKLVVPGELGRHAIAEGSKAVTNYVSYKGKSS